MKYTYKTSGVCSSFILLDVDGETIKSVEFDGGCVGNSLGIGKLVEGMPVSSVIERLSGIRCGRKKTSCPDQLALALQAMQCGDEPATIPKSFDVPKTVKTTVEDTKFELSSDFDLAEAEIAEAMRSAKK